MWGGGRGRRGLKNRGSLRGMHLRKMVKDKGVFLVLLLLLLVVVVVKGWIGEKVRVVIRVCASWWRVRGRRGRVRRRRGCGRRRSRE